MLTLKGTRPILQYAILLHNDTTTLYYENLVPMSKIFACYSRDDDDDDDDNKG